MATNVSSKVGVKENLLLVLRNSAANTKRKIYQRKENEEKLNCR